MKTINVIEFLSNEFYKQAAKNSIKSSTSVLDVGCGYNSILGKIKGTFTSTGIDVFRDCIQVSRKAKNHNRYVIGDIRKLNTHFSKESYDTVIALDVIEHLTKNEAQKMIVQMEKIAKKRVVIMTPNGFYPQEILFGNPHQKHKSGWYINDLKALGYKVYGLRGLKYIRGIHAMIQYKPWILWAIIAFISEPLLYFFPKYSYHIFAIKEIN
jgi:2-polyprenyl-3-methyl-5-hydroxy-6-metoxy-1,4-benzoquinol methylase